MSDTRSEVAARHRDVAENFSRLVGLTRDWDAPAPVAGWCARDVVVHLVEWSRGLFGQAQGLTFGSLAAGAEDPVAMWRSHCEQLQLVLDSRRSDELVLDNEHFGRQPLVQAIGTFYVPDVFLHSWDLARATGQESGLDQAECAEMLAAMESQEEMLRAGGQFGTRQSVAADASSESRLMAFIGRDPNWSQPEPGDPQPDQPLA